jgi:hypothetical protein
MNSGNLLERISTRVADKAHQVCLLVNKEAATDTLSDVSREPGTSMQSTIIELQQSSNSLDDSKLNQHLNLSMPKALDKLNSRLIEMKNHQEKQLDSVNTTNIEIVKKLDLLHSLGVEQRYTLEERAGKHLRINKKIDDWLQYINKTMGDQKEVLEDIQKTSHKLAEDCQETIALKTTFRDITATNSTQQEGPTFYQHKPVNSTVDPMKTVVILKDVDKDKVRDSRNIKSTFNRYFPNMAIKSCFISKGGSVFIELESPEDAKRAEQEWEPKFFTKEGRTNKVTTCSILVNMNNSVLVKGVPLDISNSELTTIAGNLYTGATVRRFVTKDNNKLTTVKIDFRDTAHQEHCIAEGLKIGHQIFRAEKYIPRQRIVQCYNCYRYGHVAKFCRQEKETCKYCSGDHCFDKCPHDKGYYKCRNCGSKDHHAASNQCRAYIEIVQEMKLKKTITGK